MNKKSVKSAPKKSAKPAKKMTPAATKGKPAKKSAQAKKAAPKGAAPKKPMPKAVTAKSAPMKATPSKPVSNKDYTKILTPLDDRILVETLKAEKKSSSGLVLIDSAPDSYVRAKVLAVGRGKRNKFGKIRPLDVQTGDKVLYTPRIGNEIKVSGQDLFIIRESDVLGIIEE